MNNLQQFTEYTYRFPDALCYEDTIRNFTVHIEKIDGNELEFDLIGLKPYIVNIFRQTILNDVPTMAIEDVYFYKNSSIFNCDYISQRLSILPIKADPDLFKFVDRNNPEINSENAIVMKLSDSNPSPQVKKVMSGSLTWHPVGENQKTMESKISVLIPNIPICCLKQNEDIEFTVICTKNTGNAHMKYHPGFGKYVFLTKIEILDPNMSPENARLLQGSFPPGVIELDPTTGQPFVANPRLDRHSRAFKNYPQVENAIKVNYYRDHVIFNIESHGVLSPVDMFQKSVKIVRFRFTEWRNRIRDAIEKKNALKQSEISQ